MWTCKVCFRKERMAYYYSSRASILERSLANYYALTQGKVRRRKPGRKTRKHGERREFIRALKSKPCMDCGGTFHFSAMEFDHCRGEKLLNIGHAVGMALTHADLLKELKKCDLVCANCHNVRTWKRRREPGLTRRGRVPVFDETGKRYEGMAHAARELGVPINTVANHLRGLLKHAGGHVLRRETPKLTE